MNYHDKKFPMIHHQWGDDSPFDYPDHINWDHAFDAMPAYNILDKSVDQFPDRPAVQFMGRTTSYGDLGQMVDDFAAGLQSIGIGRGSKVGLFLPNCPYFMVSYFAILKTGATVVNYNPLYAVEELEHQIGDSGTDVMITLNLSRLYDPIKKMLQRNKLGRVIIGDLGKQMPLLKRIGFTLFKRSDMANPPTDDQHLSFAQLMNTNHESTPVEINPVTDIALLQYTGGTTGVPKGAALTHANIAINAQQSAAWFPNFERGQETMLGVIPFFHVFAMTAVMNVGVLIGAKILAIPRFDLDDLLQTIHRERPTIFPAVPTIYTAINNHPRQHKFNLSSIKYCVSGGAPLPVEVKSRFETITGCDLVEGYGLTECSPVVAANPPHGINKPGSIGLPLPATHIDLRDPDTRRSVELGNKGEIWVKGPQVMAGYHNRPADTDDVIDDDGWCRTGDIGKMDKAGYLYIVDRIKDVIIAGGYNIYPRQVEEAIYDHIDVAECIVAGVDDAYRGQTVKAWIKRRPNSGLTDDHLRDFLADKLSKIEIPKQFDIRDTELPKTMVGKLSRKAVLEEEEEQSK